MDIEDISNSSKKEKASDENLNINDVLNQNIYNRELLKKVYNKEITSGQFISMCNKRYSFWQWSNKSYNIKVSNLFCKHNCTYCYMKSMNDEHGRDMKYINMNDFF